MEESKKILDTMKKAGKALKTGEIVEMSGLDKEIVDKAMKTLRDQQKIFSSKESFWEPK